jgi:ATP-dependent DNA helicase RecG
MPPDELDKHLAKGENIRIEFKKAREKCPKDLFETVSSFLNREGGTIILGADDNGNVTGIDPHSIDQMTKDIITALNNKQVINPPVNFPVHEIEKDDKKLLYIQIPVSSQVHTYSGIIYDREHDSDIKITDVDRISEIYFRKRNDFTENKIYPSLTIDDLDPDLFDKARSLIRATNSIHPWLEEDNMTILRRALLYRKDFKTGEEGLTLAAALIFGKDETIQSILPAYKIDALVRKENLYRWDDRLSIRTNLIDSYQQLMGFVKKHLPDKFFIEGNQRKDLRELIFREIVGNILVHREYTNGKPTQFIIYRDKVETINPNKVIYRGILQLDTFSPYPKNPNIRKFFTEFSWADEIGSGIMNVNKYLPMYANGAKPLFIEDDEFMTVIPLIRLVLGNKANILLELVGIDPNKIEQVLLDGIKDITVPSDIDKVDNPDELLYKMGLSWHQNGVKLEKVRFLINKDIRIEDLKKELSIGQKGVKLLKNRGKNILKILMNLVQPLTMEVLMEKMEFRSRSSFRDDYIKPLRDNKLIDLTIPDKLHDPGQSYIISEQGKMFLGGFEI